MISTKSEAFNKSKPQMTKQARMSRGYDIEAGEGEGEGEAVQGCRLAR